MSDRVAERLREFASAASVEVTPRDAGRLPELAGLLPSGSTVYITALPSAGLTEMQDAAVEVRRAGHVPVPHIAVRGLASLDELDGHLAVLASQAQVDDVLVIAGSVKSPKGGLTNTMQVLSSGLLERHGIRRVGVAGHPEGTPDISPEAVLAALAEKNEFARTARFEMRVVTQFALAPEPYVKWERDVRTAGNRLPVVAGLPGVTSPPRLLKYALACGIGPSVEVLRKQSGGLLRLATTRVWKPDAVVEGIVAAMVADPDSLFRGIHMFPFGGLRETAVWLADVGADETALPA
ncbi:MAG: methylenetetrahydrofolate reductase [Gaiellales bacterium]